MWRQMVEKMGTKNTQEADNNFHNFHRKRNSGSRRRRKYYPAGNGKFSEPEAVKIVMEHLLPTGCTVYITFSTVVKQIFCWNRKLEMLTVTLQI
jgi:hypothetical protein